MKNRRDNDQVLFSITHGWDENSIKYDANGNIQALRRDTSIQGSINTGTPIDELKYTYSASIPDQLTSVYDTTGLAAGFRAGTGTYTYDANGNLTYDPYKGIAKITYDVLNRTDTIKISSTQYITYTYNAGGSLLRKEAYKSGTTTQITDYLGGWVYTGTSGSETLQYAPMPEGRLLYSGGVFVQQYIITDPQGNARVSFQNNGSGVAVVKQENSYYGYGLIMPGTLVSPPGAPANKQLYNGGSEWQNDYSTLPDYYQSYNRNYDAALARWVGVDPMAGGSASMSVYHYSGDNPIMMNDPDGDKSAAPGSQYVDYDNAEQGALQNMYQGSIGGCGSGGGGEPTYGEVELELMMGSGPNIIAHGQASDPDFLQNYNSNVAPYLPDGWLLGYNSNGTGKNYSFNAAGQLIGVQPNGLDENSFTRQTAIDPSAIVNGTTFNDLEQGVLLSDVAITAAQAAALGLTGSADQGGDESLLSQIWNSPLVRAIIPDDIGIHLAGTLVATVGGRYSYNFDYLTRGKDAGFHMSQGVSGRVGAEAGFTADFVKGWYIGSGQNATFNSLTGWGADGNIELGPVNAGIWASFRNTGMPSWVGTSVGTGWGIGGSAGVGYTWPVK